MAERLSNLKFEVCTLRNDYTRQVGGTALDIIYRTATSVGHLVYIPCSVRGGENVTAIVTIDLNLSTWWSETIPGPCRDKGNAFLNEETLVYVGMRDAEAKASGKMNLSTYDLVMKEWSTCQTTGTPPSSRHGCFAEYFEKRKKILLFGGKSAGTNGFLREVHLLDVERRSWIHPVVKGQRPSARAYGGSCLNEGVFYCYGGLSAGGRRSDGIYVLQLGLRDTVTWSKPKVDLDGIRSFSLSSFALVPFQGVLVFCGGVSDSNDNFRVYDPETGTLSKLTLGRSHEVNYIGYGICSASMGSGRAFGLFGIPGRRKVYVRVSMQ